MGVQVLLPAYWWPARQLVQLDFRSLGFGRLSSIERNETAAGKMEYEYLQVMRRRSGQLYLEVLSMAAITPLGFDFRWLQDWKIRKASCDIVRSIVRRPGLSSSEVWEKLSGQVDTWGLSTMLNKLLLLPFAAFFLRARQMMQEQMDPSKAGARLSCRHFCGACHLVAACELSCKICKTELKSLLKLAVAWVGFHCPKLGSQV